MATTLGVSDLLGKAQAAERAAPPKGLGQGPVASSRPQYLFIHTVRFWSMLAIVLLHGELIMTIHANATVLELVLLIQVFKFGTIGFFLISGFLLGDRLPASRPFSYLRRRASRLVPAWCVWFVLEVGLWMAMGARHWTRASFTTRSVSALLLKSGYECFTGTALWFVPNFMIALTCIVLLRRWLNDLRMGAALLTVTLFYTVNVYMRWIPSRHSEALFGFAFYLWLGAWCALRKEQLLRWAMSFTRRRLLLCLLLAAVGALLETRVMILQHNDDYLNTLRLSNQVFSVVMVILLVRVQRVTWPKFMDVGAYTYGIYLTHTIILSTLFGVAIRLIFGPSHHGGPVQFVGMWAVLAPASYALSLLLSKWLAGSRWPWLVGALAVDAERRAAAPAAQAGMDAVPAGS